MKQAVKQTGRSLWVFCWLALGAAWPFIFVLIYLGLTSSGTLQMGDKHQTYFISLLGYSLLYLFIFSVVIKQLPILTRATLVTTIVTAILIYLVGSLLGFYPAFW